MFIHQSRPPAAAFALLACLSGVVSAQTLPHAPAGVEISTSFGIQFSTVRAGNNLAFHTDSAFFPVDNRGVVAGDYRMSRTEITMGQWQTFINTFAAPWEYRVLDPVEALRPAVGVSWRDAARYCNWLTNGATSDPASLTHGAYDTSTFAFGGPSFFDGFTDQPVHSPGALFWIPSLDEWIRAAFTQPGSDRWWLSHYGRDTDPVSGMPGVPGAETDAGESFQQYNPVDSYASQSPWGLLGTSGGANEWLEDAVGSSDSMGLPVYRLLNVSTFGAEYGDGILAAGLSGDYPDYGSNVGFRIAAAVPGPGAWFVSPLVVLCISVRRRR